MKFNLYLSFRNAARLVVLFVCLLAAGFAQAQDTALVNYTGKYVFPAGSAVDEAFVSLENGVLSIKATLGEATLKRLAGDSFSIPDYNGKVEFTRDEAKKVAGIKVLITMGDIDIEGKRAGSDSTTEKSVAPSVPAKTSGQNFSYERKANPDIEAHQGGCGLFPCNTIGAFLNAVKLGVNTLELDCVISKDNKVLVSHDQFMSRTMITPEGKAILPSEQLQYNIYKMTYDSVKKYDAGSGYDPGFPDQKKFKTYKPLLSEVFDQVERYIKQNRLQPVQYNIEIKSLRGDNIYHPAPGRFTDLVMKVIKDKGLENKVMIQSFDVRALRFLHDKYPGIRSSYLVNNKLSFKQNVEKLGFIPSVFSPEYKMLTPEMVEEVRQTNVLLIPWTIDKMDDMLRILDMGVDGIITNYPDVALGLVRNQ